MSRDGHRWRVEVISHGRTSGYLNPRIHRAVVQFTRLDRTEPRRYAPLPVEAHGTLDELGDEQLVALLADAKAH